MRTKPLNYVADSLLSLDLLLSIIKPVNFPMHVDVKNVDSNDSSYVAATDNGPETQELKRMTVSDSKSPGSQAAWYYLS